SLDRDRLKQSLDKLLELHQNVSILHDGLQQVHARQDRGTWSARGTTFQHPYADSLADAVAQVARLREQLCAYRDTLTASADRLALMDAEVQDRLARLAARQDGIVTAMPAQNAPWQAPAAPTTGYVYDPKTRTGFDPSTGATQVAPPAETSTTTTISTAPGSTAPVSSGSGIG
ncbi:hypothetical protein, partial [Cellulomonas chitinilytica]|uniref:hypothetical protein n=1 Tax=Cellulomonas chitinilytica TaxID=398759 RepID=UPI0019406E04